VSNLIGKPEEKHKLVSGRGEKGMAEWRLGTMGFGYKDWQEIFYPAGIGSRDYLGHYSKIFNAVEMDTTFYGTPRQSTVDGWSAAVSQDFRFCAKVPRIITHELELVGAAAAMKEFTDALLPLGDKLGAVLIQLPPSFDITHHLTLAAFLEDLPNTAAGVRVAIEFRHPSWYNEQTASLLRSLAVCWAATEYPHLPRQIYVTTDFLYIRWIGQHGTYDHHSHERVDKTPELETWLRQIQAVLDGINIVFGFFNNDYAGFAAGTCNRFKEIAGLPFEPFTPPAQGRLF